MRSSMQALYPRDKACIVWIGRFGPTHVKKSDWEFARLAYFMLAHLEIFISSGWMENWKLYRDQISSILLLDVSSNLHHLFPLR